MPNVAVVGIDKVSTGLILTGSSTVFIGSDPVATVTSTIATHSGHTGATISAGSSTVFIGSKALGREGDPATCGHSVASGNSKIISG